MEAQLDQPAGPTLKEASRQAVARQVAAVYLDVLAELGLSQPPGAPDRLYCEPEAAGASRVRGPSETLAAGDAEADEMLWRALLRHDPDVKAAALPIIADRLGAPVGWVASPELASAGDAMATLVGDEIMPSPAGSMGMLHAPPPTTKGALAPWARWLGRWQAAESRLKKLWQLATHDQLTGAVNRRYFDSFLRTILEKARVEQFHVTLLLFDIDHFKQFNDTFGHRAGDEVLRETAQLIRSAVREHDVAARIGGDEFAVIFWDSQAPRQPRSQHPHDVQQATARFRQAIREHRFPKLLEQTPATLTISGGLAGYPHDGRTPEALCEIADQRLLTSKRLGKNVITVGPGAASSAASDICNT